jgi:predicted Zn-dependent protease
MRAWIAGILASVLAGCAGPVIVQTGAPPPLPPLSAPAGGTLTPEQAARNFVSVVDQVEPVAEALCRSQTRGVNCDFQIAIDDRPGQPPNAFQTVDGRGRPILGFTLALIADARNADEIAFVLGHEAAHHIAGHIPLQQQSAQTGAIVAGVLASATGASADQVRAAQQIGASLGARTYSKEFELEADAIGAEIALLAGFDPLVGIGFFDRLPDPGDEFLGTHPPNRQRQQVVRAVVADMTAPIRP